MDVAQRSTWAMRSDRAQWRWQDDVLQSYYRRAVDADRRHDRVRRRARRRCERPSQRTLRGMRARSRISACSRTSLCSNHVVGEHFRSTRRVAAPRRCGPAIFRSARRRGAAHARERRRAARFLRPRRQARYMKATRICPTAISACGSKWRVRLRRSRGSRAARRARRRHEPAGDFHELDELIKRIRDQRHHDYSGRARHAARDGHFGSHHGAQHLGTKIAEATLPRSRNVRL